MSIKAVFFDMFFTLVDPHEEFVYTESNVVGMDPEEYNRLAWDMKITIDRSLGVIKTEDELTDRICEVLPVELTEDQKHALTAAHRERMRKSMTEIKEGIEPAISALKDMGLKIGIISIADYADCPYFCESPIYPYFDDKVFSCNVGIIKPDREIYELALERMGVRPEEALFVGDGSNRELWGAKNVGMSTVWTEYLKVWDEEKRDRIRPDADYHITDIKELVDIVKKING